MEQGNAAIDAESVATAADEESPESGQKDRWRLVMGRVVVGLLVTLLLAAVVAGWWWRIHPTAFEDMGGGVGLPNHVSVPALLPVSSQPDHPAPEASVVMESVHPNITEAPPGTRVSAWVCHGSQIGFGIIPPGWNAARGRLTHYCSAVVPVAGAVMHLGGNSRDIVILRVNSSHPGAVHVQGFRLKYRSGLQDGTQSFPDMDYRVTFQLSSR